MVKIVEQPKLKYNSFAEPNCRREAQEALHRFVKTNLPVKNGVKPYKITV